MGRRPSGGMYVDTVVSRQRVKDGSVREYSSVLLRRSVRQGVKVGKETLANLTALPPAAVDAVRAVLAGKTLIEAESALQVTRSLPAARTCGSRSCPGQGVGVGQDAGPGGPGTGSGPGVDRVAGGRAGLQTVHCGLVG